MSDSNMNPIMEQRIERLEGSVNQILDLLKTLTQQKDPEVETEEDLTVEAEKEEPARVVIQTLKKKEGDSPAGKDNEEDARMLNKMEILEEKMRAMQGMDKYGSLDMQDFCLFPDMEIPPKFKVPDFEKFEGKSDPMTHVTMYARSMAAYHKNEKLMIHCFQHSLAGSALAWFLHLDKNQTKSFRGMVEMFVKHYQFLTDITPDRFELQRMKKKDFESFREYAQRWREKASQVYPPLDEKELVRVFTKTLDGPYFERLISCVTNHYADVVMAGEQVEDALREGRLSGANVQGDKQKKPMFPKKEADVHEVDISHFSSKKHPPQPVYQPSPYHVPPYPYPLYPNHPLAFPQGLPQSSPVNNIMLSNTPPGKSVNTPPFASQNQSNMQGNGRMTIEPIPVPYDQIYDSLLKGNLIGPEVARPAPSPPPKWYNANETCKYHMGEPGHSIERCISFKLRVQKLRNAGLLSFTEEGEKSRKINVEKDPLVNH